MSELQAKLESSTDGLTQDEASRRLSQDGANEIKEEKTNPYLKFLSYFWGPIPWMIEVAVILSGVVGHWLDFFIILLLLVSNAIVGFWEEHEAGNAIAALKAKLSVKARVKRDGKWIAIADGNSVEHPKPAPDLFLYAADLIGLKPSQCVVVEDAAVGIEAAIAAGM